MSLRSLLLKLDPSQLVDDVSQLRGIVVGVGDGARKNDRKVNGRRARRGAERGWRSPFDKLLSSVWLDDPLELIPADPAWISRPNSGTGVAFRPLRQKLPQQKR